VGGGLAAARTAHRSNYIQKQRRDQVPAVGDWTKAFPLLHFHLLEKFQSLTCFQSPADLTSLSHFLSLQLPALHKQPPSQVLLKSALSLLFSHIFPLVSQTPALTPCFITLLKTILEHAKEGGKYAWVRELVKEMNVKTQLSLLEMDAAALGETQPVVPITDWVVEEWRPEITDSKVQIKRKAVKTAVIEGKKQPAERFKIILPLNFALVQLIPLNSPFLPQVQRFDAYLLEISSTAYKLTLRPGLDSLLSELSAFADLYLYAETSAEEVYKVLEVIDPNRVYFQKRVIVSLEDGRKSRKCLSFTDEEMELMLILDISLEKWADSHPFIIPLSLFAPSAIPAYAPKALDYQLLDTTYGASIKDNVQGTEDWNQLMYVKAALKQAYAQFLAHHCQYTAIYEFRQFRCRVLEDVSIHFQTYDRLLGSGAYTSDRFRTLRTIVTQLGARVTEDSGLDVVETEPRSPAEVTAASLLRVYHRCSRL